jgi:DNA-binding beta-propeller fold protein YncE
MQGVSRGEIAGAAAAVCAALLACNQGGANANQKGVGDQPGGVQIGIGDIAVAPVGNYVLFQRDDTLAVGRVESGAIEALPVKQPSRLAFSKQRPVVYVGSAFSSEVVAVDVDQRRALWHTWVTDATTDGLRLAASPDDRFVVAGGPHDVVVLDAKTGSQLRQRELADGLVDLAVLGDSKRVLVEQAHQWVGNSPHTALAVVDLETGVSVDIDLPNCSDRIAVSADGKRAFIAPTTCQRDPVSVIDLSTPGSEHYLKNLPGFGPVAMSPDGSTAVAFLDRDSIDLSLFDDPSLAPTGSSSKYHLMLIDSATLKYEFAPVGDSMPRFAITPDGNVLLVDSEVANGTRLFDVPSRSFRVIEGPSFSLENFALSSDSAHAYVLSSEIDDVDVEEATAARIEPGFLPQNLNISADDRLLYLRKSQNEICIFDLATKSCKQRFLTALN